MQNTQTTINGYQVNFTDFGNGDKRLFITDTDFVTGKVLEVIKRSKYAFYVRKTQ